MLLEQFRRNRQILPHFIGIFRQRADIVIHQDRHRDAPQCSIACNEVSLSLHVTGEKYHKTSDNQAEAKTE